MVHIVGHRGAPVYLPENTIESFEKAVELGVDFIECDIHLSKDEKIVVMHDGRVDRTTNGKGYLKDFNLDELKKLSIRDGGRIPTLEEVLKLDFPIFIELKSFLFSGEYQMYPNLVDRLLKVLGESKFNHEIILTSFHRGYLEQLSGSRFNKIFLSFDFPDLDTLNNLGLFGIGIEYHALDAEKVEAAHRESLNVIAWTMDKREDIEKLLGFGVDFVVSNDPAMAIDTVR